MRHDAIRGRVESFFKCRGSGRVGSGRVGSGSVRHLTDRVASDQEVS